MKGFALVQIQTELGASRSKLMDHEPDRLKLCTVILLPLEQVDQKMKLFNKRKLWQAKNSNSIYKNQLIYTVKIQ